MGIRQDQKEHKEENEQNHAWGSFSDRDGVCYRWQRDIPVNRKEGGSFVLYEGFCLIVETGRQTVCPQFFQKGAKDDDEKKDSSMDSAERHAVSAEADGIFAPVSG